MEDDRALLATFGLSNRARTAANVRMGEKQAILEALGYYTEIQERVNADRMEYYQERRLRALNLLDEDGGSTYDPFNDGMGFT